jgi:hypothetical protein
MTARPQETPPPRGSVAPKPPELRCARLDDYQQIQRLGLLHSLDVPAYDDWSALWLDNPLRGRSREDFPIGWVLELPDGEIVGTMGTVRSRYTCRGNDLVAAVSRAWFVAAPYRGFALQLMDEYINQPGADLFINNAVSVPALETFSRFCDRIPLGEWDTISYWMTGNPPSVLDRSRDAVDHESLPNGSTSFSIESTDRFDSRFDIFWDELLRENPEKLLAERTAEALSWHFGSPLRKERLWILTASKKSRLRAYCTLARQDHGFRLPALPHNDTQGFRGMRLVDYQSIELGVDFLSAFLHVALQRCAAEDLLILEILGRGVPKMRVVDQCAPHRKSLENWKFFYGAADPALHAELREPRFWDPSAYDGDASFE